MGTSASSVAGYLSIRKNVVAELAEGICFGGSETYNRTKGVGRTIDRWRISGLRKREKMKGGYDKTRQGGSDRLLERQAHAKRDQAKSGAEWGIGIITKGAKAARAMIRRPG